MIRIDNLEKRYGDLLAVRGLSLETKPGEVFGLLGPNGAGKSTTIGCISGLLTPTSGRVGVLGHDVVLEGPASREKLGVVPQELALYEELTARENLDYWGGAWGLSGKDLARRIDDVLSRVGLADRSKEPVSGFSGGMKRRLNFACGVVHGPRVLLLDEPTVGVDPQSRVLLLDMVRELRADGVSILYTTHYMEEAESLCDRLAIVDHGEVIAQGDLDELRAMLGERDLLRLTGRFEAEPTRKALSELEGVEVVAIESEQLTLSVEDAGRRLSHIFAGLAAAGAEIRETTLTRPSLESLFIRLTGRELRDS